MVEGKVNPFKLSSIVNLSLVLIWVATFILCFFKDGNYNDVFYILLFTESLGAVPLAIFHAIKRSIWTLSYLLIATIGLYTVLPSSLPWRQSILAARHKVWFFANRDFYHKAEAEFKKKGITQYKWNFGHQNIEEFTLIYAENREEAEKSKENDNCVINIAELTDHYFAMEQYCN